MIEFIAIPALLAGLYALYAVGWNDALRLLQGTAYARAKVVDHHSGSDGFVPIFAFQYAERSFQVPGPTAFAQPTPALGESMVLSFPAKRPDLARPPHPFARSLLYLAFAAWLAFFSDLWLNWW
ncbi:hypothetical protein [Alteraurantiacibacter aquimixticola]|uniref:DUF3592 domain-containing protein n=1 Tax=Alteraurantiacibacter aquimixticola TaxID=2489173 RepID=A0A4T3EYM7_9SPHN|nr:hypothetical protein [Alteraurantiacibacter aquimixticola]TIX49191.1 hypothetical protein E5222_15875 [Alteraurantiacibacter aquimixticola]